MESGEQRDKRAPMGWKCELSEHEWHTETGTPQSKIKSLAPPRRPESGLPLLSLNQPNRKALSGLLYRLILERSLFSHSSIQASYFWKRRHLLPFAVFTSLNIGGSKLGLSSGPWLYFWNSTS